jgi:hypothetical protein
MYYVFGVYFCNPHGRVAKHLSHLLANCLHIFPIVGVFTSHSVLFSNLIGPPGLLLHWITCLVTGKGFGANEAPEEGDSKATE